MRKTNTKSLLELLARIRTIKALDRAAKIDSYYRATLKEQNMAYSELEKAGLDRKQKRIVDKVFTAINANGAAYGKVAYKLGLHDGIRLMLSDGELREKQTANYFSDIYPIDCAVLSANAQSCPKCCTLLPVLLSA